MTYATQQNMIDRFGEQELIQLTDRATPQTDAIVTAVLDRALADADAEINGHLSAKFTLPLDPVPTVMERLACDIARYYLYDDRVTDAVKDRFNNAVKFLKGVVSGEISIGVDAASEAPAVSGGPRVSAPDRVFTQDSLSDY